MKKKKKVTTSRSFSDPVSSSSSSSSLSRPDQTKENKRPPYAVNRLTSPEFPPPKAKIGQKKVRLSPENVKGNDREGEREKEKERSGKEEEFPPLGDCDPITMLNFDMEEEEMREKVKEKEKEKEREDEKRNNNNNVSMEIETEIVEKQNIPSLSLSSSSSSSLFSPPCTYDGVTFRPPCPIPNPERDPFCLQIVDIDCGMIGGAIQMRVFGTTLRGNSVMVHVSDFSPYFFFKKPTGWAEGHVRRLIEKVSNQLQGAAEKRDFSRDAKLGHLKRVPTNSHRIILHETVRRKDIMGYTGSDAEFVKVYVSTPHSVSLCASILGKIDTRTLDFAPRVAHRGPTSIQLYETNVDVVLRFMSDKELCGAGWMQIDADAYVIASPEEQISGCQIELACSVDSVLSLGVQGEYSSNSPFVVASFDIECVSGSDMFPNASEPEDHVVMIATTFQRHGEDKPFFRHLTCWKECDPIDGVYVEVATDEKAMLMVWKNLILHTDPDVLLGYNIFNFDLPYILERAAYLGLGRFPLFGRIKDEGCDMTVRQTSSKAHGTTVTKSVKMAGRIQLDLYRVIQKEHNLSSYSLNTVSEHFLKDKKEDVPYSSIKPLFNGDTKGRTRLAEYCVKDTTLPCRLMVHLMTMVNLVEMARATGVLLTDLLTRGQQYKVFSQICRATRMYSYFYFF